jgi:glycosyltransferase involved in cell wall biosynthesis
MLGSNKEFPLVTIISLCYNTGTFVIEALESVNEQGYPNLQHIIIDDFSKDNSVSIVKTWILENNYMCTFIEHSNNEGVCKSLNEGLKLAKGEFVSFVSDDLFCKNKLTNQIKIFSSLSEDYGIVYSDATLINLNGEEIGTLLKRFRNLEFGPSGLIFEDLFMGNFIHGTAALIRINVFKTVGGFNDSLLVEDIDMYLRIAKKFKFYYSTEISAKYRIHPNSLLQTIGIKGKEQNIISLIPYFKYNKKTRAHFLNYFDSCIIEFYSQNYINWKKWFMYRWKIKKDIKSLYLFCLAIFSINHFLFRKIKSRIC